MVWKPSTVSETLQWKQSIELMKINLSLFSSAGRLINGIEEVKKVLAYKYGRPTENTEDVNAQIEQSVANATSNSNSINIYHFMSAFCTLSAATVSVVRAINIIWLVKTVFINCFYFPYWKKKSIPLDSAIALININQYQLN